MTWDDYGTYRMGDSGVISSKANIVVGIKTWGRSLRKTRRGSSFSKRSWSTKLMMSPR